MGDRSRRATKMWLFDVVTRALQGVSNDHPEWGITGGVFQGIKKRLAGSLCDAFDKRLRKLCAAELRDARDRVRRIFESQLKEIPDEQAASATRAD